MNLEKGAFCSDAEEGLDLFKTRFAQEGCVFKKCCKKYKKPGKKQCRKCPKR